MKKLFLALIVLISIVGCGTKVSDYKPPDQLPQQLQRLTVEAKCETLTWGPYLYIIKDHNNNQEYLIAKYGEAVSICPMIKTEIKAEKVE